MQSRAVRAVVFCGGLAAETLIGLAWWWHPEHAGIWAITAGAVLVLAAFVDYGSRR